MISEYETVFIDCDVKIYWLLLESHGRIIEEIRDF